MTAEVEQWSQQLRSILQQFKGQVSLSKNDVFLIGCSTSEVIGKQIGTAGTNEIAAMIFQQIQKFKGETGVQLAFQCCEHLNRALVVERETATERDLEEVTVIPVRNAGGAMATYAYHHLNDPVVVEYIQAEAGIDIGDTFIGMHLKRVVVPVRVAEASVGNAHVTLARTRPKLIGGNRAVYEKTTETETC